MKAHPDHVGACPLAAVDQRLADAHRLWHQAESTYFDPDGFRLASQNTIQTLRTVTFILQKHKAVIPRFKEWYGDDKQRGEWQERLHADPLMRWIVDARNKIEKQGDLEAHSFVRAEIIASYLDEGPRIEIPARLFQDTQALLHNIPPGLLGEHVKRNGVLRIQRRWIENTLQDHELLDALAIAFGKLSELVHDAHRQIGLDPPQTIHGDDGESYDLPAMGWRFPCMIGHDLTRALSLSLADGSKVEFEQKTVSVSAADAPALLGRYDRNPIEVMGRTYKDYNDLGAGYFDLARSTFLRDGHHISILFLFRDRKPVRIIEIRVENVQQKYVLMRELSNEIVKSGADAAIIIGEIWIAAASHLKPYERPADSSARREGLALDLVTKSGEPLSLMAMIVRNGKTVSLDQTQTLNGVAPFEFAPFYQTWGRVVPDAWIELSKTMLARPDSGDAP
jgi:hypothetical protein